MNNYQLNIHKNLGDKVEVDLAKKQGGRLILFSHPLFYCHVIEFRTLL